MRITVLGGAGKMGCISVQGLAQDSRVDEIILADLNSGHAEIVIDTLKSSKIKFQKVDLQDEEQLDAALQSSDVCLNATTYYTNLLVMEACLRNGVHYTDMGGLFHGTRKQLEFHDRYKEAGISAVLCMGSAPAIGAIGVAEGRVEPGVYAPELALDPEPFFKELEKFDILTQVSVTSIV